ncbi:MAG: hypothetical protein IT361_09550 [Gemmatimonadaceae bacterium]|nr:hypothetical protein [Gemmatimonadaceae bacterium]
MIDHPGWDQLNDIAEDRARASARVEAHVRDCGECHDVLTALRATLGAAAALPREAAPPIGLWDDVRHAIEARKVTPIVAGADASIAGTNAEVLGAAMNAGVSRASTDTDAPASANTDAFTVSPARSRVTWWMSPRWLAAAAVALVSVSSGLTLLIVRGSAARVTVTRADAGASMLPAQWQAAERGYQASVVELRAQLDTQRAGLDPATAAAVERSLVTIDAAIAEAREALLRDPASAALAELLASNYRQKVELLRRATLLDATT